MLTLSKCLFFILNKLSLTENFPFIPVLRINKEANKLIVHIEEKDSLKNIFRFDI